MGSCPAARAARVQLHPSQVDVVTGNRLEFQSMPEKHGHYSLSLYVCENLRRNLGIVLHP